MGASKGTSILGASYYVLAAAATEGSIHHYPRIHNKQTTFLGSTHGCFLGASFCDIINGSQGISLLMQNSIFFCNLILIQIFKIIFRREDPSPRPFSILSPLNYHNCQSQISFPSIMGYHTKPSALKLDLYASNDYYIFSILVFKLSITYYWPSQFISFSM